MVPIPSFAVDGIKDNLEVFTFIEVLPIPPAKVGNTTLDVELDAIITLVATPDVDENPLILISYVPLKAIPTVTIPTAPAPGPLIANPLLKSRIVPKPTFIPSSRTSIVAPPIRIRSFVSTSEIISTTSPENAEVNNLTVVPIPTYSVVGINLTPFK